MSDYLTGVTWAGCKKTCTPKIEYMYQDLGLTKAESAHRAGKIASMMCRLRKTSDSAASSQFFMFGAFIWYH